MRLCGRGWPRAARWNWSFAIVADFTDADAYRACDQDEEHNRARAGLLPMTEQIARVQFEMP
ncbi:MAG: hypothetical protein ACHP9Z_05070 [Streptosporangiales bacterium]